jgi:signal transduction histidine kinase
VLHRVDDPIWATVDSTRMQSLFVNLLNNAAKYTPEGGHIEVWCERVSDGATQWAQVRVRDDGIGLDAELLQGDRLFEVFAQAESARKLAQGGLGIGLGLARRLADLHGGTISAHSPPQGAATGSEFIVRLPLITPPQDARTATPADGATDDGELTRAVSASGVRAQTPPGGGPHLQSAAF